ncbi:hypothetical protein GASC598P17_000160 [Gilliamella apis SCGC AB-598-P17]|nr:hypothetical protein GASC598P17_000160 [Gilliamella apis SCGC AB-598-P17]
MQLSKQIKRVIDTRKIQMTRNNKLNSQLSPKEIQIHCLLSDDFVDSDD